MFQIANYGVGGFYTLHLDADGVDGFKLGTITQGDRLSTFIGYLNDVGAGGATAFPSMRVAMWPKRADAAYW